MGRKRKHDRDSCERILKKLKHELQKRRRKYSSTSSESEEGGSDVDNYVPYYEQYDESGIEAAADPSVDENETILPQTSVVVEEVPPQASTTTAPVTETDDAQKNDQTASEHIDDEILTLLGDAPKEELPVGKDIHPDIATRLIDVIQNGLRKEQKDKMMNDYPIPGNCQLFKAPILNPEVKAATSEILQKKDSSLAARQGQIGAAITALANAIDILVTDKSDTNQIVLKHVSNACRLLCDSHFIDTKLRRGFLISTLNNNLKDTLKESKRDKHLFGENLPESLRATKAINKTSYDLKSYVSKPKPGLKTNKASNHLNWKQPQSNQQNTNRKNTTSHRTAGSSSTAHRNEMPAPRRHQPTSSARASRPHAHYKNQKRH